MSNLKTLKEEDRETIEIVVAGLLTKVEEFTKYTKKTDENINLINMVNNLTAMLTSFREVYYFETDKVVNITSKILAAVDVGEKNKDKNLERNNTIIKAIKILCKTSNSAFHANSDTPTKEKAAKLFATDYAKYVKGATSQNDYKYAAKSASIYNIFIKKIKTIFGKERTEEIVETIEIQKFASDESVVLNIGQLLANRQFDNFLIKVYPNKLLLEGALFGHNVNFEIKSTDTKPLNLTTTLRPKVEALPADKTPAKAPVTPVAKAIEKPIEEKKVAAAPPVATPTPPVKEPVVEPTNTVTNDDDEPPSFDDFVDVDDEEQDNEQEYL